MLSHATLPLNQAESVSVKNDDAQVLRDRTRKPQRHRLLHGYPLAAAMRRSDRREPAEDVCFDPRTGCGLPAGVLPHPFCNLTVPGCGFGTFAHERYRSERAGEVVEHAVRGFDRRLARQRPLSRSRVAALYFGLEFLAIIARLGFAVFLTVGLVAAIGLTSGMSIVNPIAVPLCTGFFLWSLVVIWSVTGRNA
jgi:hypothetical protein